MAEIWVAAGATVVAGGLAYAGSQKASKAAQQGSAASIAEQQREYDLARSDLAPYRAIGTQALNALGSIYGYKPADTMSLPNGARPFSATLPSATNVPGGSLNIGGSLVASGKLGTLGKILDPAASLFGNKHGDERRNLNAFLADNQLYDLGNGLVQMADGRTFTKDQLQQVAGAYYGATYHPDGDQAGWQQRYNSMLTAAPQPASGPAPGAIPSDQLDPNSPNYGAFFKSPDYNFRRSEGIRDIGNSFSAAGGAKSGNALKALAEWNSNLAGGEFGNYFNRQAALAGIGQTATNTTVNAGMNTGANISNALISGANARASGIAGGYDALAGGLADLGYLYGRRNSLSDPYPWLRPVSTSVSRIGG